jgi:hypothetical protein
MVYLRYPNATYIQILGLFWLVTEQDETLTFSTKFFKNHFNLHSGVLNCSGDPLFISRAKMYKGFSTFLESHTTPSGKPCLVKSYAHSGIPFNPK